MLIFEISAALFLVYVAVNEYLYLSEEKHETDFLSFFDEFLSHVRHFYYYSNSVEDAVFYSIPQSNKKIRPILDEVLEGLESENKAQFIEAIASGQHKYVRLFASLALMVSENGDLFQGESSAFLDSVMQLRSDVQDERRYLEMRKHRFMGLSLTAALPILAVPFVADWGADTIPSLKYFYCGRIGVLMLCMIFFITVICYRAVNHLREGERGRFRKTPFGLLKNFVYRSSIGAEVKKFERRIGQIRGRKVLLTALVALGITFFLFCGHKGEQKLLMLDVSDVSNTSAVADGSQLAAIERVIPLYMQLYAGSDVVPDKSELTERLLAEPGIRTREVAEDTAVEIINRLNSYERERVDLADILIVILAALVTYMMPGVVSTFTGALLKEKKQEEVMQFQSLIHMQKRVPGITPVMILESMEAFADIFKDGLQQCIDEYSVNDSEALKKLAEREQFGGFVRIIDCFLAIDEAGVEAAFEEVSAEIVNFKANRELERTILLDNNAMLASLLAVLPGGFILFGYLLIPFMVKALKMFEMYQGTLGGYIQV